MATPEIPRSNLLLIKDMTPMSRNFDCEVIVLQREGEPASTRDGDLIYRYLVADKTATIVLSVWGVMGRDIRSGDILRISGVDNKLRLGHLFISTPKSCKIKRVGQDTFPFVEKPNMSEVDHHQVPAFNNNNRSSQQHRMPRHQDNANNNSFNGSNNNMNNNRQHRGYQNNNDNNNMSNAHPYNNRGRGHRGGYRGRGGNNGNRYHQDLDNPAV